MNRLLSTPTKTRYWQVKDLAIAGRAAAWLEAGQEGGGSGAEAGEAEVRGLAEREERVKAHLAGKTVRKVVYVPKRLINFVVA